MKRMIMIAGEYAIGIFFGIVTLFCLLLGFLIGIVEVPRYLRIKMM